MKRKLSKEELEKLETIMDYIYGSGVGRLFLKILGKDVQGIFSPRTKRLKEIRANGQLAAVVRASDNYILFMPETARKMLELLPKPRLRIVASQEAAPFVKEGRTLYAKHVVQVDQKMRAGSEILVVDENDQLLALGKLALAPSEVTAFKRGRAVRIRKPAKT